MSQYKIGQLAKIMGVSSHLLKHYEKFGLVVPVVDDSTNYRYYDISQCTRIIESKKYRNLGFSLSDIADLMNYDSNQEMEHKVEAQIHALEEQIKELELQKRMATMYLNESKELDEKLNQWYIEPSPSFVFLKQSNERKLREEGQCVTEQYNFLDEFPLAKSALYLYKESFQTDEMQYHWGILKESNQSREELCEECMLSIPASRCFCTYLAVEKPYMYNGKLIGKIKELAQEVMSEIEEDVLAIRYKIVHKDETEVHYFKIYIPLK